MKDGPFLEIRGNSRISSCLTKIQNGISDEKLKSNYHNLMMTLCDNTSYPLYLNDIITKVTPFAREDLTKLRGTNYELYVNYFKRSSYLCTGKDGSKLYVFKAMRITWDIDNELGRPLDYGSYYWKEINSFHFMENLWNFRHFREDLGLTRLKIPNTSEAFLWHNKCKLGLGSLQEYIPNLDPLDHKWIPSYELLLIKLIDYCIYNTDRFLDPNHISISTKDDVNSTTIYLIDNCGFHLREAKDMSDPEYDKIIKFVHPVIIRAFLNLHERDFKNNWWGIKVYERISLAQKELNHRL